MRPLLHSFIAHRSQGAPTRCEKGEPLPAGAPLLVCSPSRPARAHTQSSGCYPCGPAPLCQSELKRVHTGPRRASLASPSLPGLARSCPRLGLPRLASVPSALDCARNPLSGLARSLARARPPLPPPSPAPPPAPPAPPPPPVQLLPKPPHTAMLS